MSARVQSLEIRPAPVVSLPMNGSPAERSMEWGFRMFAVFLRHPKFDTGLHGGVTAILVPRDDPEVAALNLRAVRHAERAGKRVVYRYLDAEGRPLGGKEHRFTIDLRESRWGRAPRAEFFGKSAEYLRKYLDQLVADSQQGETVGLQYNNVIILNGVRIFILDEPEPGLYDCIAFEEDPRG